MTSSMTSSVITIFIHIPLHCTCRSNRGHTHRKHRLLPCGGCQYGAPECSLYDHHSHLSPFPVLQTHRGACWSGDTGEKGGGGGGRGREGKEKEGGEGGRIMEIEGKM